MASQPSRRAVALNGAREPSPTYLEIEMKNVNINSDSVRYLERARAESLKELLEESSREISHSCLHYY